MITFALAAALSAAAPPSGPPMQPRNNFASCLSRFTKAKMADKMAVKDFQVALKAACAAEETAFKSSIVAYDVKMGTKRPTAEERATAEIEDYFIGSTETYEVHTAAAPAPK